MKISNFKTDAKAELEGVWVDIGEGGRLKIARAGNANYNQAYRDKSKPHWTAIRAGALPLDELLKITVACMAEFILRGWDGIEDDAGNAVPYTVETATDYLLTVRDFRELVTNLSEQQSLFRAVAVEDATKN